jgi:hyperosmotically inducible periplasmic protein
MKSSKAVGVLMLAGVLTMGFSVYAAAGAQASATAQLSDETIESRVEAVLKKDAVLAARDIDVESKHGRVTLTGKVKTADERAHAATIAKIEGVTTVVNELKVDPNADRSATDRAAEKTKEGLNKAVDATAKGAEKTKEGVQKGASETAKGVGKAAEKTAEAVGTAGDKLGDAAITTKVKAGFSDEPMLKGVSIDVDTKANVVTLRGTVPSAAAKVRAGEIATRTSGVTRVVNELVVTP